MHRLTPLYLAADLPIQRGTGYTLSRRRDGLNANYAVLPKLETHFISHQYDRGAPRILNYEIALVYNLLNTISINVMHELPHFLFICTRVSSAKQQSTTRP